MIRAGQVQRKHVKAPAVNILSRKRRRGMEERERGTALLMHTCVVYMIPLVMSDLLNKHTRHVRFMISGALPWGSLRLLQVGLAWLQCRPSWTSWNNAMFMLSSVKVQMLTLSSELDSGAVYINPLKPLSAWEGCFKEKSWLMFHSVAVCVFWGCNGNETVWTYIRVML